MANVFDNKAEFIAVYREYIKRDGSEALLDFLEKSDFYNAPASTRFHSAEEGGLCAHTLNVFKRLKNLVELEEMNNESFEISEESVAIAALLHDICKVNIYKVDFRNVKNKETGTWDSVPYYTTEDKVPYGHGEKSVYIVSGFMRLTREEAMAINWHMGGFDQRARSGDFTISAAYTLHPLAVLLHTADLQATYLDEKRLDK